MGAFERLQDRLGPALAANSVGSTVDHVVVALPSYSMSPTLLAHYRSRLPALEHRFLLGSLQTARIPGAHVVLVTSAAPSEAELAYYARLARPDDPDEARRRLSYLEVPDPSPRGVASKLLDRADLMDELRQRTEGRLTLVEPWNVTTAEVEVALALDAPINGTSPGLWPLGFKSSARRLFRESGVPVPCGVEDVHDQLEVAAAILLIRRSRPDLDKVVVKVDNSGSGEGNWVISTRDHDDRPKSPSRLHAEALDDAPTWFTTDLSSGGVVEELVDGPCVTSPSAQVDLHPDGVVRVLATHEQVLGGEHGQEFTGSRFPADRAYAGELARHVEDVGRLLAKVGAVGRVAVDFVAKHHQDGWALHALDLNLRKGGTTHSFAALRHLVPGAYDAQQGRWLAHSDGAARCYRAGDAVVDPAWLGLDPAHAIEAVAAAGLEFDHLSGSGVVLHMLSGLAVDGRIGVTAIARDPKHADELYRAVPDALHAAVGRPDGPNVQRGSGA